MDTLKPKTIERSLDGNETGSGKVGTTMKITNGPLNNGIRNTRSEAADKKSASGVRQEKSGGSRTDRVELSGLREVEKLAGVVASMPSQDAAKIESIKSRIADGTYNVSGYDVAEKMLRSMGILNGEVD